MSLSSTATTPFALDAVSKSFGSTQALQDVSLTISPHEKVALIGPSGSGKSTLLRLLGTSHQQDSGSLSVLGNDPHELTPKKLRRLRSRLAFLPQDLGLVPNLRVISNVLSGRIGKHSLFQTLRSLTWPPRAEIDEVFHLLERVGIEEKLYDLTDTLSGGQQQRVAIARALYQKPAVLLADEPVSALDPKTSLEVVQLLNSLSQELGFTLVVSLHDLELARSQFPRIIGLREGKVVFDGKPENLSTTDIEDLFRLKSTHAS